MKALELPYTGTGFVASPERLILTNRHVARPWEYDGAARKLVARGSEPVHQGFIGYLPGEPEPFDVSFVAASDEAAVLPEFGGSNLGVPVERARALLERVREGGGEASSETGRGRVP